jgi:malate dehydrogenase (oxaloacetate-decarboxylating)
MECDLLGLHASRWPRLDEQVQRQVTVLRAFETDFARCTFLRLLQDTNETLLYAVFVRNMEEILSLICTPTAGESCRRFSEIWRKLRGMFLSYPNKHRIRKILAGQCFD